MEASTTEFGVLVALFGVGASVGLAALARVGSHGGLAAVRGGVVFQGLTIAVMSFSPNVLAAFAGAIAFGGGTAFALAAGMRVLQQSLEDHDRLLAFSAFHVVIRAGLSLAAIAAGVAADVLGEVELPLFGTVPTVRLELASAGVIVVMGGALMQRVGAEEASDRGRLDPR